MEDYDKEVAEIRKYNQPILDDFQAWLEKTGLTEKTVSKHIQNVDFLAEYLFYYEPLYKLDEADAVDVYSFLANWYPRKAMWASVSSTKSYIGSFRKFFKFLVEGKRVDKEIEDAVRKMLKERKEEILDAVDFGDDDDDDWW